VTRVLLLMLPLLLVGCGAEEPARVKAPADRIAVTVSDFRYTPQNITAKPGRLEVTLTNRGRLAHTFRVERKNTIVKKVSSLLPGDTATTSIPLRKGEYRFFCALSNHEELGMYGTLVVR
jgi:plastocyanin